MLLSQDFSFQRTSKYGDCGPDITGHVVLKVIILGPSLVGKTCLADRFFNGSFDPGSKATLGVDFSVITLSANYKGRFWKIALQLWDLAGEERFRSVMPMYVTGTQGALLTVDISRPETTKDVPKYARLLWEYTDSLVPLILVGTKADLRGHSEQCLPVEKGHEVARKLDQIVADYPFEIQYLETSAKTGENVDKTFYAITRQIINYRLSKGNLPSPL